MTIETEKVGESTLSPKRILILTCSAGSGHLQAAKAKVQEIEEKYPEAKIYQRDLLIDLVGHAFGRCCATLWNNAQLQGNAAALEFFTRGQKYVDPFIRLPIFLSTLFTLIKEDIDTIIDTQPLGTKAIIKAIRYVEWRYKKSIHFEKIVTDLPTKKASHFFRPIRKLSPKDHKYLHLVTTFPLLEEGESEASFWKNTCRVSQKSIHYSPLPIRKAFLEYAAKDSLKNTPLSLEIKTLHDSEADLIEKALSFGTLPILRNKNSFTLQIQPEDKVCLLMLGSNPHKEAILRYIDHFIAKIKDSSYKNRKDFLFIFCSLKNSLQETVVKKIEESKQYPSSLTIIPLPYQEDSVVAPLFHRCNASITRSGGLTSMELLAVSHGHIWIHLATEEKLLPRLFSLGSSGMPIWERGNADYLQAKKDAQFITPETFPKLSTPYFPPE